MLEGSCHCGAVHWRLDGFPESATACNCTICRRSGALHAYGFENEGVHIAGQTSTYVRADGDGDIELHFCPVCGCIAHTRDVDPRPDGRRRMSVNLRLSDPAAVAPIPIRHFDGFDTFTTLPPDGRCVKDMWF